ncbi:hypothetical protein DOTSEDRAFT_68058 [Dothistroma septosporum NZE10]|uniref:Methyltransferase domain-containing protein n=1 Tax=Dothistroma septosporum (strain NZE10 / CBS 128990) TaxID=675120 RepID=N1Q0K0_DOTSN|nr:hypothetical protein DOTSEDRAFT_68058 [Dothistroma septosporum NZE10]
MSAFTEANRKAFNDLSATYNTKQWQIALSNQVAEALQARKDWLGAQWLDPGRPAERQNVRLLDYACGTGAVTKALGPYVTTIRGVDVSENMVTKYNEAAQSSGLTAEQAQAVVGDLFTQAVPADLKASEYYEFDIAVVGLGFHHFEHPDLCITRLAERLKAATGVLVIIDFLPFSTGRDHDHSGQSGEVPEMKHTIKHNGFTGDQMRDLYEAAGFVDFDIVALKQPAVMELKSGTVQRTLFIAKGRKAETTWQKLSAWVGSMQDWAAGGLALKNDRHQWEPGYSQGRSKPWDVGRLKEETYTMVPEQETKKPWNGF